MRRALATAFTLLALAAWGGGPPARAAHLSGKYRVLRIELSFGLESKQTRVRLALNAGEAIDVDLPDAEAAARALAIAQIVALGGRAYAAFDDGQLRTLFVAAGQPGE